MATDDFSRFKTIKLPTFSDSRGVLTVMENVLPFSIKRTYWIYGADGQVRGGHRHVHSRQALIAVNGQVSVFMDDGTISGTVLLGCPNDCLVVEPKDWHTMTFGAGAILLVMSSHAYDRAEYIDAPYQRS